MCSREGLLSGRRCECILSFLFTEKAFDFYSCCLLAEANLSFDRYGEDKELTEDYAKDIWEFGY
jgi:hypothetical protein